MADSAVAKIEETQSTELATTEPITPMQMLKIAVDQNADLDKLEKLMDMQERWEANEARKAFVSAMNAFKKKPPTLTKNNHVSYEIKGGGTTEYDHATLDQVSNVIGEALSKQGISHRWQTDQLDQGIIKVTCVLTHDLGHSESTALQSGPDASGGKNSIQAIGSTVTYLQRYTLLAATGMAVQNQDNDGADMAVYISANQKDELIALIKETGADIVKFLKYLDVPTIDEIWAKKFDDAKAALEKKRNK